jgi:hypothetical protein
LATVLDADGDGVISANELKNASKALSQLDRNRDGKITRDEMYPRQSDNPGGRDGVLRPGGPGQGRPDSPSNPRGPRPGGPGRSEA